MDLVTSFLPETFSLISILLVCLLSLYFIWKIDWVETWQKGSFNVWAASIFFIAIVWMIRASLNEELNIHLSGAMLMALMFGWRLGILGMSLVCVLISLWGNSLPSNLGISIIFSAYLSVSLGYIFFLIVEAFLPRNVFIYLFVTAFFCAGITFILTGISIVTFLGVVEAFSWSVLLNEYLPYYCLMSFGEAFMTCGLITMFVVYRPQWVFSFRDKLYLVEK